MDNACTNILDDTSKHMNSSDIESNEEKHIILYERQVVISKDNNAKRGHHNNDEQDDTEKLMRETLLNTNVSPKSSPIFPKVDVSLSNVVGKVELHCKSCPDYLAKDVEELNEHRMLHEDVIIIETEDSLKCALCKDFVAENADDLKFHRRLHSLDRPYPCELCDFSARLPWTLKMHVRRIHTKEKPYKCTFCDYCATDGNSVKVHTKIHTVIKQYKCDKCVIYFSRVGMYNRHMKTHTKEKRLKCKLCDFTTLGQRSLWYHNNKHKKKAMKECKECTYDCDKKGSLCTHKETHKKEKNDNNAIKDENILNTALCIYSYCKSAYSTISGDKKQKIYSCYLCKFSCTNLPTFAKHIHKHIETEETS